MRPRSDHTRENRLAALGYVRPCVRHGLALGPISTIVLPSQRSNPHWLRRVYLQRRRERLPHGAGNVFTEQHFFYKGVEDDRQCSACTCGAPAGSACTATISIYKGNDLTCGGPPLVGIP